MFACTLGPAWNILRPRGQLYPSQNWAGPAGTPWLSDSLMRDPSVSNHCTYVLFWFGSEDFYGARTESEYIGNIDVSKFNFLIVFLTPVILQGNEYYVLLVITYFRVFSRIDNYKIMSNSSISILTFILTFIFIHETRENKTNFNFPVKNIFFSLTTFKRVLLCVISWTLVKFKNIFSLPLRALKS